jgi:protein-L-isoaspartate(D-aspartate) O-methyltransferase
MTDFLKLRERMVDKQIAARGIADPRILAAFRAVPREAFVPEQARASAYEDMPLPIEAEQTISQPYIVALMAEAAEIAAGDRVLEVGAGSGYAAAILAQLADEVFAIERHEALAKQAGERMERLGFENVSIFEGDGTGGLPSKAPFEAILCSASGSHVPDVLLGQLEIGGRLVMPIGEPDEVQRLVKVTRVGDEDYEQEEIGAVRFVPLIGAHAWNGKGGRSRPLAEIVGDAAESLPEIDDEAFAGFFDRFADARVVMLGEASHGTSEFYRARAAVTRRLVERHGFNIVAVEADWPDAASIDRYVRHRPKREGEENPFSRFPTWMWRNREVDALVRWLRAHNEGRDMGDMAGFYGLDLYNMGGSIRAVIDYLDDVDPDAAAIARERYGCLAPWRDDPQGYGRMAISEGYARCEAQVIRMLRELLDKRVGAGGDGDEWLDAAANAASSRTPRNITGSCITAPPRAGTCATRTCSRRSARCSTPGARIRRRWSGRITAISAMPPSPRWASSGRSSISASW